MKAFKLGAILFLFLQLILPVSVHAQEETPIDYLALGDSLAVGIQETGEMGLSYADFLAKQLTQYDNLGSYNKGFSYPGYTTADVLTDIKNNVKKPIYNLQGLQNETATIREAIANAEIITISVGANDILKYFNEELLAFDLQGAFEGIQQMGKNYEAILTEVAAINPEAAVFITGYYNPFPHLEEAMQVQIDALLSTINKIIEEIAFEGKAIFVETANYIAEDYGAYLPNPENIHLSEAGYQLVAELVLAEIDFYFYDSETDYSEIEYVTFTDTEGHWAEEYISFITMSRIMQGYEDGSFKPDQELKRVHVATIMGNILGTEAEQRAPFVDIATYAEETQQKIAMVYEAGIMRGNNEHLRPEEKITRAQMALMMARLYNYVFEEPYEPKEIAPFKDIVYYDVETQKAITLLYDFEIDVGKEKGIFAPKDTVTRAEAAQIITDFVYAMLYE